jgi:stage II sporulation protein D
MISYRAGNFSLPFVQIRSDLGLRSSFFSVRLEGDTVILSGRGYGHGAGLCQEGAMVMASRGFDFRKIIAFYYSGVSVTEIRTVSAGTE